MDQEKNAHINFFSDVTPIVRALNSSFSQSCKQAVWELKKDIILGGIGAMLMVTTICLLAYAVSGLLKNLLKNYLIFSNSCILKL